MKDKASDKPSIDVSIKPVEAINAFFSLIKGENGVTPSDDRLVSLIRPLIPPAIPGKDGKEGIQGPRGEQGLQGEQGEKGDSGVQGGNGEKGERGEKGEKGEQGAQGQPSTEYTPDEFVALINSATTKIDPQAIRGLTNILKFIEEYGSNNNPMGAYASGGSNDKGLKELSTTDAVDGTRVTFSFSQKPTYIVSDGVWYKENSGWTWDGTAVQATLSIPPSYLIFAIA